jgi:tRNA threonylcarbamoyladenosine biosynthesis protein TsaB
VPDDGYILAIEITNPGATVSGAGSVALGRLSGITVTHLDVEPVGEGNRPTGGFGGHDDDLMPAIDRIFARAGITPRSGMLSRVGVSVGPGGYTSTRVACAAGKMIAEAAGAASVAVPTAQVLLESLPEHLRSQRVAISLAAKGDTSWIQIFENGESTSDGTLRSAESLMPLFAAGLRVLIADRHLPAAIRAAAESAKVQIIEPTFDAGACAKVAAHLTPMDPAELVPLYPREPDAVTLWRNKKKP